MKVFAGLVASALAAPAPVIIGGKNASDGQFPHQVTLKRSSGSHYCGGSIINTNKVCDRRNFGAFSAHTIRLYHIVYMILSISNRKN